MRKNTQIPESSYVQSQKPGSLAKNVLHPAAHQAGEWKLRAIGELLQGPAIAIGIVKRDK